MVKGSLCIGCGAPDQRVPEEIPLELNSERQGLKVFGKQLGRVRNGKGPCLTDDSSLDVSLSHDQGGLRRQIGFAIFVLVLLGTLVPVALASEDPGEGRTPPAPPTALEMQEGLNDDNSTVYADDLTNLDVAEELPHTDLDRGEALDLLSGVFDPMLRAPAGVFDELDVERFLSANSAIIAAGDQPESSGLTIGSPPEDRYEGPTLLESTIPLRAESDSGKTEPVDLGLEREGGGNLSPSNPLVALSLPQQLGDGIKLPESGITLELPSAPDQLAPSTLDQGVAAYPEVAEDTTFAVSPAPGGFETFTLLQSSDAPTSQVFTLDLPADATLVETDAGGAEVRRDGKPIMGVSVPTATDAAGESVPVTMSVSGYTLSLSISPTASTRFPILVDPLYETYNWWNGITGLGGWHGYTNAAPNYYFETKATCTSYASPYACQSGVTSNAPGLYIGELPGPVAVNSQVNWQFEVPRWNEEWTKYNRVPKSFITNLIYRNVGFWHRTDTAPSPTLWMGIWNSLTPGWVSGYAVGGNSQNILGNGEFEFPAGGSTAGKQASFAVSNTDGHNLTAMRDAFVNTAIVTIADTDTPNLAPAIGPSNWVNQVPSEPITVTASDFGLGVYRLKVAPEGPPPATPWPVQSNNCTGSTVWPCSGDATFTLTKHGSGTEETRDYDPSVMPQGVDNLLLTAEDPLGNKSETKVVKVWVDHTAPVVGPLTGTATEQASLGTKLVKYGLNYSASDGDDAPALAIAPAGTAGTAAGQLERPWGVAVDGSGDTWVTDRVNNRLLEYDKNGTFVRQTGGPAESPIKEPRLIDVAPNGNLLVAEVTAKRIRQFTQAGTPIASITNSSFVEPFGVAVGPEGTIWVTDISAKKIFQYKEDGSLIRSFNSPALGSTDKPLGIDVDEFGNGWVAIQGSNRVVELSPTGAELFSFGSGGTEAGKLNGPQDVEIAPSGNILVSDGSNNRVQIFKPDGRFLRQFGSSGTANGQFNELRGIAIGPENQLVVADAGNKRVARWTHADQDPQSGAAKVAVKVDGITKATNAPGCPEKNCVINGSWSLNADEYTVGSHKVEVVATDAAGISSAPKTVSVETHGDRTAPTVVLSGSITEQATLGKTLPSYKLKVAATDPGPAEERKSGVAKLEIKVDGALVDSTSPGCPSEGCSLNREWTLNSSSYLGSHFVTATATDAAGKTKTVVQTIEVLRDESPPEFQNLSTFYTAPSGWLEQENYEPKVDVLDAKGYGVTSVQLKIDGKVVQSATQTCSAGSCSKQFGYGQPINMATYSGGAHPAELVATDGAGNIRKRTWTINVNPSDTISGEEAIDTLEASDDTAEATVVASAADVISPLEKADGNDPSIGQTGESFVVTGVPTETKIPDDPTAPITVPTPEGSLKFDPLGGTGGGAPTVANGAAVVAPNTSAAVDTVVRPIFDGFLAFADIRDSSAPETYSWRVVMGKGQALKQIDSQTAVVLYPEDGTTASMIRAEPAHDATGKEVITSLVVEGTDVVTLTVKHKAPGLVYPVVGGPRFEVGYIAVRAVIPPEPGTPPVVSSNQTFYGYTGVSAPEPIDASDGEASSSGVKGVEKHFLRVECSHTGLYLEEQAGQSSTDYTQDCGNPFQNRPGKGIAYRYALHGKYLIKEGVKVWHEGGPNDHIGCFAEGHGTSLDELNGSETANWTMRRAHVDRCVWWGATRDGGGNYALYGKHITPVGRFVGEERGGCADDCGRPNPWIIGNERAMAFYLWASGHIGFHQTDCIDCY
jgi:NHL repeat-containing protein